MKTSNSINLAQSASAIGVAILGFGLGARWGNLTYAYSVAMIIMGAILHVYGMYLIQMKNKTGTNDIQARVLLITAWICLILLAALFVYLTFF